MNKHGRPFTCHESSCNRKQGFTSADGLLRHQREVHKKYIKGPPIMCPYVDCNRRSGNRFTRRGNLESTCAIGIYTRRTLFVALLYQANSWNTMGVRANHPPVATVDRYHDDSTFEHFSEANDIASLRIQATDSGHSGAGSTP